MLVCTGKSFTRNELQYIKELKLEKNIIYISATEEQMVRLYRDAELFVYPSYYEGFGLPLLEAMVCDCPIICSNTSCFPEIAQDAACYFDPYSQDEMYMAIMEVLTHASLRDQLILKGKERVRFFSWAKTAQEHLDVYKSLM
jgi:glycosyltransferase involved in cell wall biosynthesis